MAFSKSTRQAMEKLIYSFFDKLDPSGANTRKFKEQFSKMSDKEFDNFFKKLSNDNSEYLILDIVGYEHEPTMEDIEKAAKLLGVPLFETVIQPNVSRKDGKAVTTITKVPVGYIHMKALQQMVRKKNSSSISVDQRDPRTGQVTGDDKDVQFSIDENYGLMAHNAKACLKEFLSLRADDMTMKQEAYAAIRKDGYVSLSELTDDIENKTALNTFNAYLLSMHMKTDIIDDGYMLNSTVKKGRI